MCIPFFGYIVKSTEPKKGFSILFSSVISFSIFLFLNPFSYIGAFFLFIYLILFKRTEKLYYLFFSFISFLVAAFNLVGDSLFIAILPIMLVSSIFSLMMIGHWFLVDPTISRVGMKNIAKSSMFFATVLCLLLITGLITNDISTLYRNIILGLYISSGILSLGAYKSLNLSLIHI